MSSIMYVEAARAILAGEIDFNADTFYIRLLCTNTTADTEKTVTTVAGFTTLDEHDSAGQEELANIAVAADNSNLRAEFDADDVTFTALAAASSGRDVQGALLCHQAGGSPATSDIPIAFLEYASNKTPDDSDFVVRWDTEGIVRLTVP